MIDEARTMKIIAWATAAMLAVAIAWVVAGWRSKAQMQYALDHERLRAEALLAEKLSIEEKVEQVKADMERAGDSIARLAEQVTLLSSASPSGAELHGLMVRLDLARARQTQLERQLDKAYHERRRLVEQNVRLLDTLRRHGDNGEWIEILKMEIIGVNE